jgi:hypothetical protein
MMYDKSDTTRDYGMALDEVFRLCERANMLNHYLVIVGG